MCIRDSPDSVVAFADEVVNIDLTADELVTRLKEGKIYAADKIERALNNFFKSEHILQLRELALKEVASQVERKVESEVRKPSTLRHERFLACISSNEETAKNIIRKTARLANYYNSKWYVPVSYTHLRAHETVLDLVCRLLLEKKKNNKSSTAKYKHNERQTPYSHTHIINDTNT